MAGEIGVWQKKRSGVQFSLYKSICVSAETLRSRGVPDPSLKTESCTASDRFAKRRPDTAGPAGNHRNRSPGR